MRLALTLAWLRWRCFVNSVARRRKRSGAQRLSGWLHAGSTAIVTLLGLLLTGVLAVAGFAGGMLMTGTPDAQAGLGLAVRVLGFMIVLVALIGALQGGSSGESSVRLLLLPVSRLQLTASSILASAADPLVVLTVPAAAALCAGLAWGGRPGAAIVLLPSVVAAAALLVGFDALVSFGVQLLLRDRRRGETVALVLLVVLMFAGFLPALIAGQIDDGDGDRPGRQASAGPREIEDGFGAFDAAPPGLFARALQRAIDGRPAESLLHGAALGALAAATLALASAAHARLLSEPGRTSRRKSAAAPPARALRLPGASPETLAIASVAARTALRTVRGKIATFTPPLVAGAIAIVFRSMGEAAPIFATMSSSTGLFAWCVALTLLNQQPIVLNAHAVDRAGLTLLMLQPADERRIVRGKMLGHGLMLLLAMIPAFVIALSLGTRASVPAWLSALLAAAAAWLLHSPVGLLLSALFPKAADMSKISGQQPHGAAGILGAISVLVAMGLPRLVGAAGGLLGGPWASVAATAVACAAAAGLALPVTGLAADMLASRRESVVLAAQGR